jgi:hypothetical protein
MTGLVGGDNISGGLCTGCTRKSDRGWFCGPLVTCLRRGWNWPNTLIWQFWPQVIIWPSTRWMPRGRVTVLLTPYTECPTRYRTQLAGGPLFRVATTRRTTDTFLFISHTTNVLLFKFRCNIFIGVRIIKEMPGSVASGTPCISERFLPVICHMYTGWFKRQGQYFGRWYYWSLWRKEIHMNMCVILNGYWDTAL